MSASLLARRIALSFGSHIVLNGVDVSIGPATRLGIVGPNGSGKSTLLKVLTGIVSPDEGSVTRSPSDATVGLLEQEAERSPDETVLAALSRRTGITAANAEFEAATAALSAEVPLADERYADALERWLRLGAPDFEARAATVTADLGIDADLLEQATSTLSGGQMAKVSLAAILLARFDIVLLDEPTNDLDFDGLARLERFVNEYPGGLAVVSHDREFLERTITSVLEFDEHTHQAELFNGGWLSFLEERDINRGHAEERYAEYQVKRRSLEERARSQRQWAVAGSRKASKSPKDNDKAQRDFAINRTEKQASKVRITEKALERLGSVDKPWEGWELQLEIESAPRSGDVVFRIDDAVVELGQFRLGPIDLEINWADRVAVVGANGSGKTTLLETLLGRLPLSKGQRFIGPGVVVGEFDQYRRRFAGEETLLRVFDGVIGEEVSTASEKRSLLAKFGLGADHLNRSVSTLSPGERGRAVLATFMARGVNCLVLDEPTNHLDVPAIEQLERVLGLWQGTLLLVSHDRRLLDTVHVDRTVQIADGRMTMSDHGRPV